MSALRRVWVMAKGYAPDEGGMQTYAAGVALAYRAAAVTRPLTGYGYLVTRSENLSTLGVLWESSIFPGRAPQGTVLLRMFLGGARCSYQ